MSGSKGMASLMIFILIVFAHFLHPEASGESRAATGSQIPGEKTGPVETLESVRAMLRDGRYAEAEASARKLLAEVEARTGTDSLETARVIDVLVECFWRDKNVTSPEARELAERAVAIKERTLGPEHPEVSKSLQNQATLLRMMGDYAAAKGLYQRALAMKEKSLGPNHPDVARPLYNLASLLVDIGGFAEARGLFGRALQLTEKALGPDHLSVAIILNAYANLLRLTGEYREAKADYERVLAIREKAYGPEHHEVASSLNNLGLLLRDMGDYAGARSLYGRALEIREKVFGPEHPLVAQTLYNMAGLLMDTGDHGEARAMFEHALALREKSLGPEHRLVADTLHFLALLQQQTGHYTEARTLHERALAIYEKVLGVENYDVALTLDGLASLHRAMGDAAGAEVRYERALAIREKVLGPNHPEVAESLRSLAGLRQDTKGPASAASLYQRALAIQERVLGPEHPSVAPTLVDYAALLARAGEKGKAFSLATRAETISREHILLTARTLSERQALRYASVRANGLDLSLSLVAQGRTVAPEAEWLAWDSLIRSRALVLDEMAARHGATGLADDPEVATLARKSAAARERLAHLVVRGAPRELAEGYRGLLDEARNQAEEAERSLAERNLPFRKTMARQREGLAEVAASLPPRSALLAFALYERSTPREPGPAYLAFLLRAGEKRPVIVPLGPALNIEGLVSRWHEEAARDATMTGKDRRTSEAAYRAAGEALRRVVWDPLAPRLRASRLVFVVPDGALNLVNFVALPVGESGYLIESGPLVHYLSAERDLAYVTSASRNGDGLLAVGEPAFDDASQFAALTPRLRSGPHDQSGISVGRRTFLGERSGCGRFETLRFEPLPASALEAEEVALLWRRSGAGGRGVSPRADPESRTRLDVTLLTGTSASEAAFKELAPGRRVLHVATHGFFLSGGCPSALRSLRGIGGLATAPENEAESPGIENPLLMTGLALSGANHRAMAGPEEEDGVLTAEEIAAVDLRGVEWAVLSGCDTGRGEVLAGEGVLGLRRAFQTAGARTVIMSLWPVADEPAREWMRELYAARLLRHLDTAEAVREASLTALRRLRDGGEGGHPFGWAAFVAAGDWR